MGEFVGTAVCNEEDYQFESEYFGYELAEIKAEIEYAHEVLEIIEEAKRMGRGVVSLRGKMIDAPIVNRAKQVIEMEKAIYGGKQ